MAGYGAVAEVVRINASPSGEVLGGCGLHLSRRTSRAGLHENPISCRQGESRSESTDLNLVTTTLSKSPNLQRYAATAQVLKSWNV
jgi:hypothetical protein